MGVNKLWEVVQGTGRVVTLESLRGKRIAIDISIWLHRFIKAMKERSGKAKMGSHILGVFFRCCKLLFFNIQPIFVFDGEVPHLKLQTIMKRRQSKELNEQKLRKTARELLLKRMEQFTRENMEQILNDGLKPDEKWIESLKNELMEITGANLLEKDEFEQINEIIDDEVHQNQPKEGEETERNEAIEIESDDDLLGFDFDCWFVDSDHSDDDSNSMPSVQLIEVKKEVKDEIKSEKRQSLAPFQVQLPPLPFPMKNKEIQDLDISVCLLFPLFPLSTLVLSSSFHSRSISPLPPVLPSFHFHLLPFPDGPFPSFPVPSFSLFFLSFPFLISSFFSIVSSLLVPFTCLLPPLSLLPPFFPFDFLSFRAQ